MDMSIDVQHIQQCAPSAPASIVEAIIRTESGFNPFAINVNRAFILARQPASRREAETWARWLLANGYNFDSGLMQINSANLEKLGLTPETMFDVCENIRAGARLFTENYSRASAAFGPGRTSLVSALSAYNTGDFNSGVRNGYVSKVVQDARTSEMGEIEPNPPLIPADKSRPGSGNNRRKRDTDMEGYGGLDPCTVPTALDSFRTNDLKPWDVKPESESTPASGEPEPGTVIQKEMKSSTWRKEFSTKSKRLLITVLLAVSLLTACAGQTPIQPSALLFRYTVSNSEGTGLIRAFDDQKRTVLQFVELEHQSPVILDEEGRQVHYQCVGQYAILDGIYRSLTVQVQAQRAIIAAEPWSPAIREPQSTGTSPVEME